LGGHKDAFFIAHVLKELCENANVGRWQLLRYRDAAALIDLGNRLHQEQLELIFDKRKHVVHLSSTFLHELMTEEVDVTFVPPLLSQFQDGTFRCQRETKLLDQRVKEMVFKQ
jgi:hypothetical protein